LRPALWSYTGFALASIRLTSAIEPLDASARQPPTPSHESHGFRRALCFLLVHRADSRTWPSPAPRHPGCAARASCIAPLPSPAQAVSEDFLPPSEPLRPEQFSLLILVCVDCLLPRLRIAHHFVDAHPRRMQRHQHRGSPSALTWFTTRSTFTIGTLSTSSFTFAISFSLLSSRFGNSSARTAETESFRSPVFKLSALGHPLLQLSSPPHSSPHLAESYQIIDPLLTAISRYS